MLFLLCVSAAFGAQHRVKTVSHSSRRAALRYLEGRLHNAEKETWYWQRLTGEPRTDTAGRTLSGMAVGDLEQTVADWERRARRAHHLAQNPPHMQQWMCIHHYEGAWNDVGGPYWGGLQMSLTFQERYGGWLYQWKGNRRPLDAPGADLDGGKGCSEQGFLALAEHCEAVRPDLTST